MSRNESNIIEIRKQFPTLHQQIYGKQLIYLDNAATSQKPLMVLEAVDNYYKTINSNIHRGVHYLSQKATIAFEEARKSIQSFINARHSHEIIFTRGTTESINLVASGFAKTLLSPGKTVLISAMEHHSNIVPWQMACESSGAKLNIIPINSRGELLVDNLTQLLQSNCALLSITHISNTLGTINDIKKIIDIAHQYNVPVLIDGAQAVAHTAVDVDSLDCDFYCFSGHKMYAPMGIGILYGKESWLEKLPPYQGGGEMIKTVSFEKTTYNELPFKFEAGTPDVGGALGLQAAVEFIKTTGYQQIHDQEAYLLNYASEKLAGIDGIRLIGTATHKASVLSFLIGNIHPYDAGMILDKLGIAVRTGHHCTQPLMDFLKIPGTIRASFAVYNTSDEVDQLAEAILTVKNMFE